MFAQEPVHDAACGAASERTGKRGRGLPVEDGGAVRGGCCRLWAEHERGAELRGRGAGGEDCGNAVAGSDAAGSDQSEFVTDRRTDQLQQGQQPQITGRAVIESAAVPAGLHTLHDDRVRADCAGHGGLAGRRRSHPDRGAGARAGAARRPPSGSRR